MDRELCRLEIRTLTGGERFATVVRDDGCPSFFPTAWILSRRRAVALNTLLSNVQDLIHLGQWAQREDIDIHERLRHGQILDDFEIDTLVEASGLKTEALRRLICSFRSARTNQRNIRLVSADRVSAATKARRLGLIVEYLVYVGQFYDQQSSVSQEERIRRRAEREAAISAINGFRPRIHGRKVPRHDEDALAKISRFIVTGDPSLIWSDEAIRQRNWALITLLATTGMRQGEARQLTIDDVDLRRNRIRVRRRPDDPDDPRIHEPNAKTTARDIPISDYVASVLEDYLLGANSDAVEQSGSKFLFVTHANSSTGHPISSKLVGRVVCALGDHLGVPDLIPHELRHAWIQALTEWAIENGVAAGEFDRLANYLGGWSQASRQRSEYLGDYLTKRAYEAGLRIEGER